METPQLYQLRKVIDIIFRRATLIFSTLLIGIIAGLAVYLLLPKVYLSSSVLKYDKQNISPAKLAPDSIEKIGDVVSSLTQFVTSRTSLEKIILTENLYPKEREKLPMEDVVEEMRKDIIVEPSKEGDVFRVAYQGNSPGVVYRVANSLAARFVEENIKYREERATGTSSYTKDELMIAKDLLDSKEAVMRDYKLKYYNEMADQRENNTERLIALQNQYHERQNSIQDLERTRILVRDQIALRKEVLDVNYSNRLQNQSSTGQQTRIPTPQEKIKQLAAELEDMQARYTKQHPKVKSLQKKIAALEKEVADLPGKEGGTSLPRGNNTDQLDRSLLELQNQLASINANIEAMNTEKKQLSTRIQQYEQWISKAPIREAEWSALTREYDELKRHYDHLVGQNLQAGSVLHLERTQKGSQFKIIDPAQLPNKPIKPDFLKTMLVALLAGLGIGVGIAFALENIDTSFREPFQMEEQLGVEVLCSLPHLPFDSEAATNRKKSILTVSLLSVALGGTIMVFLYFLNTGKIVI